MKQKGPLRTPFSTHLSGSAKETELRLRSIFQWRRKRPSVMLLALVVLVACREQAVPQQPGDDSVLPADLSETDCQLWEFVQQRDVWQVQDESEGWGYAVTDLDQDGRWEMVSYEMHGTGHILTTGISWNDGHHPGVTEQTTGGSSSPEELLKELSYGGAVYTTPVIFPSSVPSSVYYDRQQEAYYYIYEDTIREEPGVYFSTLSAWSLRCGERPGFSLQQGKPGGVVLGCRRCNDKVSHTDCWDGRGHYITSEEYERLAKTAFPDLEPMSVQISGIWSVSLEDLEDRVLFDLLKDSMECFSLLPRTEEP